MSRKNLRTALKSMLRGAAEAGIDINNVRVEYADGKLILLPKSHFTHDELDQELKDFEARNGKD